MYILECEKYREMEEIKKRSKLYYIRYIRDFETGHVSWHQLFPIHFFKYPWYPIPLYSVPQSLARLIVINYKLTVHHLHYYHHHN